MSSNVIVRGANQSDRYNFELHSIWTSGYRIWNPDFAIAQDPEFPEKARRDPVVMQGLDIRTNGVAAKTWTLLPRSERDDDVAVAAILEDVIREGLGDFRPERKQLAMSAFDGRAYAFIEGERRQFPAGPVASAVEAPWWTPTRLKDIGGNRIQIFYDADRKRWRWKIYSVATGQWNWLTNQRQLIAVVYNDAEERLGYGRALRDAIYYSFFCKTVVQREGMQGLERWAQGVTDVAMDAGAQGDETTNDEAALRYIQKLRAMVASYGVRVHDKRDEVTQVFPQGTGHQMVLDLLNYYDGQMTRLLTGALLPAGGGSDVGSLARSEVEEGTSEGVIQYDRGVVDRSVTGYGDAGGLVKLAYDVNRPLLAEAGLEKGRCPLFSTVGETREDPAENRANLETANRIGLPVTKAEAYERLNLTQPEKGEEVLEPMQTGGLGQPGDPLASLFRERGGA